MANESTGPKPPPDPTNPAARRPLEPGEAEMGAKQLEAWNWAKAHAPNEPGNQQILASQYLYKTYGILPNNGQGDWQNTGGGAHGWKIVNGDLVPNDRSWFEKYGGLAVAIGLLTAGTASAVLGGGAAAGGGLGGVEGGATAGLGPAALPGAGTALGTAGAGAAGAGAGGTGFLAATQAAAPLSSTTIGTGAVGPITGGTGMSTGGGFLGTLKDAYDLYQKGKGVYDTARGSSGPSTASTVGQTAGSIEQQRMNALIAQAKIQQEQDALGLSRTNAGVNVGNLNLAQQKQALAAPGQLANQSVRGDILANGQDASFSGLDPKIHVPTMSGGLRPSLFSAATRTLGGQMSRNALADSTSGKYTTMAPLPKIPGPTPLPEANGMDKVLQGAALGGGFLDALKNASGGSGNGASSPTGQVPGDITDAQSQLGSDNPDTSNLPNNGSGIDPELLAWFAKQSQPGGTNG